MTTQTTKTTDAGYTAEVLIAATPDAVYAALMTLEGLAGWWAPVSAAGPAGEELSFHMRHRDSLRLAVAAADPGRLVRWEVIRSDTTPEWPGTTITFTLTEVADGTELRFTHDGLTPQLECFEMCRAGWDFYLPSLRDHVESGTGRPLGRTSCASA